MEYFRFTKVQNSYAPQIIWQVEGYEFALHPKHYQSSCQIMINENQQALIWQEVFKFFSFLTIDDLISWIARAKEKKLFFFIEKEFLQAAGFSVDDYRLNEFLFLYHCRKILDKQNYSALIFLIDNKNLPLRTLIQFLRRFYSVKKKQFEHLPPNFFLELATLFSFDYIKKNSVREILKMMTDLSLEKILKLLQEMQQLQKKTHFDSRHRLNQIYFKLVENYRYPLLQKFDQTIKEMTIALSKQQKNITLHFHPSYEKSDFTLSIRFQNKKEIMVAEIFFSEQNKKLLLAILSFLQDMK